MGVLVIFNITLTVEQLEVVGLGLDELKFKIAAPVAKVIQAQFDAQVAADKNAANPVPPVPPKPRGRRRTKKD